jgi:hypothetical protein
MEWIKPATGQDPLLLSAIQKNRFAAAALDHTYNSSKVVPNYPLALTELLAEFDDLCRLNQASVVSDRFQHFKVPNALPEDFCERIFAIESKGHVLAGIRFAGGNPEKPFVSIWPDFPISSQSTISLLTELATQEFFIFDPKEINFWLNPETDIARSFRETITPCLRIIVGRANRIRMQDRPQRYDDVTLIRPDGDEYLDWYAASYRAFHELRPDLRDWVPANDRDQMEESRRHGLLFLAHINGIRAGLIAAIPRSLLGHRGVYFIDIVMSEEHKGKGLAHVLQRKFIDGLSEEVDVVWGSIDAKNITSTKTALRVGRSSIREEFFVPLN